MFGQDSERTRLRGQASWGSDYASYNNNPDYGHNQSVDSRDDFRNQSFGRNYEHEDTASGSKIVCQNYLQNKCLRGNNCLFLHPTSSGSPARQPSSSNAKKRQNAWLNFCVDFQRGQCPFTDDCRLLHVSKRDEAEYRTAGDIPTGVVEQAMSKAMVMDWAYIGNQPHCKDYLQGSCRARGCNYRHLNTDQYVVEVLAALREKFLMSSSEMFPDSSRESGFPVANKDVDQYGSRQAVNHSRNTFGNRDNFEPDTKRMRPQESKYQMDDRRQNRSDNRPGLPLVGDGYSKPPGPSDDDILDALRRDNIKATKKNEDVKKSAQMLEDENAELRKALRLALDLNGHARNLQEFRNHLRDIQATLKKRGYQRDNSPNTGSWNNMQIDPMSSSQDNRMYGERYPSGMTNTGGRGGGGRYSLDYDRSNMQRSDSNMYKSPW